MYFYNQITVRYAGHDGGITPRVTDDMGYALKMCIFVWQFWPLPTHKI